MMRKLLSVLVWAFIPLSSHAETQSEHQQLAFEIFKELVESDTTHSTGNTLVVVERLAARLKAEGFPDDDVHQIPHGERKSNLVARLRSANPVRRPILLLAHLDVVEADPADWSMDPKKLNEIDGYYYGRGTLDDKDEVAIHMANLIMLKREGVKLQRDVIVAFTSDEEGGPDNGALHLVTEHRELVDAAFVLNEGGGGQIVDGKHVANTVQAAEKVYQSYHLEITNPGGHSSLPRADNAIYELAHALIKIEEYAFPVMISETTRAFFEGSADLAEEERSKALRGLLEEPPDTASLEFFADQPPINARLRTTCIATELEAGHAENALPQRARATVNCRVFPGVPVEEVRAQLRKVIGNDAVSVTPVLEAFTSDASPLTEEVMNPIREITEAMWPGANVLPIMSTGATDGLFFRNAGIPVYGVSGIFRDIADNRAHGRDERIRVKSFYDGLEFLYRLTRAYAVDSDIAKPATQL